MKSQAKSPEPLPLANAFHIQCRSCHVKICLSGSREPFFMLDLILGLKKIKTFFIKQ
jgi:hypothetical protein